MLFTRIINSGLEVAIKGGRVLRRIEMVPFIKKLNKVFIGIPEIKKPLSIYPGMTIADGYRF